MSPTVFRWKGYRFFFFSREEERMHVHVFSPDGEAKFWLEPEVSLCKAYRLSPGKTALLLEVVKEHRDEIAKAWREHLKR